MVKQSKLHTFGRLAATAALSFAALTSQAAIVEYTDFSDVSDLVLNGDAATAVTGDGSVLRLTPATFSQSGSAFSQTTVNAANFSTYFSFRISSPGGSLFDCNSINGADGLVFVAQSVSSSARVAGGGIGYAGIGNSLGVEWDTSCNAANNDPSSNHIGVNINGNVNRGAGSPHTANIGDDTVREDGFDNGEIWHAWVDYDGTTVEVRTNQTGIRSLLPDLTRVLDLPTILGQDDAYIGFTSGTGADYGQPRHSGVGVSRRVRSRAKCAGTCDGAGLRTGASRTVAREVTRGLTQARDRPPLGGQSIRPT